jgi:hypothetical protein
MKANRVKTLIGLELGGRHLVAVEMHRSGGQLVVRRKTQGPLSLDPLTSEPELAAREIANLLAEGSIRGSNCLLCLPLSQLLTHQIEIPEIDEADLPEFLGLEVERVFPFSAEDLVISTSYFTDEAGRRRATLAAISTAHVATLENVLRLAKLRPVSITLGSAALVDPSRNGIQAAIARNEAGLELVVAGGGGLMLLRALGDASMLDEREGALDAESLARETRITLGRLPKATRDAIGRARAFIPSFARQAFLDVLAPELEAMGVKLALASVDESARVVEGEGAGTGSVPAGLTMAMARWMQSGSQALEFLPPSTSKFLQVTKRLMGEGGLWRLGGAAAMLLVLIAMAFAWQGWRLSNRQATWNSLAAKSNELDGLQAMIVKYRPWFDDDAPSLAITSKLVQAFPETGTVWAKNYQIDSEDASARKNEAATGRKKISCSGNANARGDVMRIYQSLLKAPGFYGTDPPQFRGDGPVQFTLTYSWNPMESR